MTHDDPTTTSHLRLPGRQPVRMRGPADMAAMLPYLIGFYPDDSIVAVGLHGPAARQGGAIRLDIPENPVEWPRIAGELVELLIALSEQRDERPDAVLLYLVRDPEPGADPVMAQLRPLAATCSRPPARSVCRSGRRSASPVAAGGPSSARTRPAATSTAPRCSRAGIRVRRSSPPPTRALHRVAAARPSLPRSPRSTQRSPIRSAMPWSGKWAGWSRV